MKPTDPILIVEDDIDDQKMISDVLIELDVQNPVIFFERSVQIIDYLVHTNKCVFLILCDVNLPGMNGIQLRREIDKDPYLRKKSIPFIFYTTSAAKEDVNKAFDMMVQGYFEKPHNYESIKNRLKLIIDYWKDCIHPNNWDPNRRY